MIATTRFDDGWKGMSSGLGEAYPAREVSRIADQGTVARRACRGAAVLCHRTLIFASEPW